MNSFTSLLTKAISRTKLATPASIHESGEHGDTNQSTMASIDGSEESATESKENIDTDQHVETSGDESGEYDNTRRYRVIRMVSTNESSEFDKGYIYDSADESGVCSNIVHGTSNHIFLKYRHLKRVSTLIQSTKI